MSCTKGDDKPCAVLGAGACCMYSSLAGVTSYACVSKDMISMSTDLASKVGGTAYCAGAIGKIAAAGSAIMAAFMVNQM